MTESIKVYTSIQGVSDGLAAAGIKKDRVNTSPNGYKFRGIDDVYNSLARKLVENNLVILPRVLSRSISERTSRNGGALFYVTLEVEFDFVCTLDGSKHTIKVFGEAMDSSDKATNKAMSAAYKYAVIMTFCVPIVGDGDADEDDDGQGSIRKTSSDYEAFEAKYLPVLREAAMIGSDSLKKAGETIPASQLKKTLSDRHGASLKKAAQTFDKGQARIAQYNHEENMENAGYIFPGGHEYKYTSGGQQLKDTE